MFGKPCRQRCFGLGETCPETGAGLYISVFFLLQIGRHHPNFNAKKLNGVGSSASIRIVNHVDHRDFDHVLFNVHRHLDRLSK